jgi:hypothetical protein
MEVSHDGNEVRYRKVAPARRRVANVATMSRPIRTSALPLGLAAALAALSLLAFVQPPGRTGPAGQLAPQPPTPADRYAAVLTNLGTGPSHTWTDGGIVYALVHDASPELRPRLRVDAALAASAIAQTCRCDIGRYAIVTDRYGDTTTIGGGPIRDVDDRRGELDDTKIEMREASDEQIENIARRMLTVPQTPGPGPRRMTRTIIRDGEVVWAFARRPATGETWTYAQRGIEVPVPPAAAAAG